MCNYLKKHIQDAFDNAMESFFESPEYMNLDQEYMKLFESLKSDLSPEMAHRLSKVTEALFNRDAAIADEAYYRGVIDGAALYKD